MEFQCSECKNIFEVSNYRLVFSKTSRNTDQPTYFPAYYVKCPTCARKSWLTPVDIGGDGHGLLGRKEFTIPIASMFFIWLVLLLISFTPFILIAESVFPLGFPFHLSILLYGLLLSPEITAIFLVTQWVGASTEKKKPYRNFIKQPKTWIRLLAFVVSYACGFSFLVFMFDTLTPSLSFYLRRVLLPHLVILLVILLLVQTILKQKIISFFERLFNVEE